MGYFGDPNDPATSVGIESVVLGDKMIRKLAVLLFALVLVLPAFSDTRHSPANENHAALHVMNNAEFAGFLQNLDADLLIWRARLKSVNVSSLALEPQDGKEISSSHRFCVRALDNTREEVHTLLQRQTLKFDFLLLVDLDELARNLDRLSSDLANAVGSPKRSTAQKSLGYAREVLAIDQALSPEVSTFKQHIVAFAGMIDATLDVPGQADDPTPGQQ